MGSDVAEKVPRENQVNRVVVTKRRVPADIRIAVNAYFPIFQQFTTPTIKW